MAEPTDAPPDRPRSVLEEEREFFLRSLHDLEAERAAGDIDETDFAALRDDYTVRAAEVLRQLDALGAMPTPEPPPPARRSRGRGARAGIAPAGSGRTRGRPTLARSTLARPTLALGALAVVLVLGGITWAVSAAAGVRLPGDGVSGGSSASRIQGLLLQAQTAVGNSQPVAAVKAYETVIAADPTNAEALTGEGLVLVQTGRTSGRADLVDLGEARLARAEKVAPTYAPAFGNLGEILFSQGRYAESIPQLRAYQRLAPPSSQPVTIGRELIIARARAGS